MAEAAAKIPKSAVDETNIVLLTSQADIAAGNEIYTKNCVACHKADGGGLVGPNLTDDFWIHGGTNEEIYKVIKLGVPAKGMIAWKDQLSEKQILQVESYILTKIYGTAPGAGAKPTEGTEFKRP
jgi:cytochrome c oxidase cbb3-type subunit 3